jgi:hypothetical protein
MCVKCAHSGRSSQQLTENSRFIVNPLDGAARRMTNSNDNENNEAGLKAPLGVTCLNGEYFYRGAPIREMLAFPVHVAAWLSGISRTTVWREIASGRLRANNHRVSRTELERWHPAPNRPSAAAAPENRGAKEVVCR